MNFVIIAGRIGQAPKYIPAHNDGSKDISQRLDFSVAIDDFRQGENEKADWINCTIWGGLADSYAKVLSPGKEVTIVGELNVFQSRIVRNGAFVIDSTGVPITTPRVSIKVDKPPKLGPDSQKFVNTEIQEYMRGNKAPFSARPPQWNVAGSPDAAIWGQFLAARKKTEFNPAFPTFGYATIQAPNGQFKLIEGRKTRRQQAEIERQVANATGANIGGYTQAPAPAPAPQQPVWPNQVQQPAQQPQWGGQPAQQQQWPAQQVQQPAQQPQWPAQQPAQPPVWPNQVQQPVWPGQQVQQPAPPQAPNQGQSPQFNWGQQQPAQPMAQPTAPQQVMTATTGGEYIPF